MKRCVISGPPKQHALLRTMGLFSLVVYGVGDMVGSGIYGTVGKAAGQMGNAVWLAFLAAMIAAYGVANLLQSAAAARMLSSSKNPKSSCM